MNKEMKEIMMRLEALERIVFAAPKKEPVKRDYAGPRGGIAFLIAQGTFKQKKDLTQVRKELAQHDYHYSRQAVHSALGALSKSGGPLVVLKESGNKYVERK